MNSKCIARLVWLAGVSSLYVHAVTFSRCDLNQDGHTNVADVQTIINQALGVAPANNDLNGDSLVNVVDVQIDINAALGFRCAADPGPKSISPNTGQQGTAALNVTITGNLTTFTNSSTVSLGPDITVSNITAANATTLTATLAIAPTAATTARDLTVDGLTLPGAFTVTMPPSVSYAYDSQGRLQTVTYVSLTGSSTVVTYSYDAAGNRTSVVAR